MNVFKKENPDGERYTTHYIYSSIGVERINKNTKSIFDRLFNGG